MAAETGEAGVVLDPMHQFVVQRIVPLEIGGVDVSFTNASLFMVIAVVLVSLFTMASMSGRSLVPGRMQSMVELSYGPSPTWCARTRAPRA